MELSQKQITLSEFSAVFFKSILNFEYFEKKRLSSQLCISEITDSQNVVRHISKKSCLRRQFNKQYGKRA